MELKPFLDDMVGRRASDLFIKAGSRVAIRVDGEVQFLTDELVTQQDCYELLMVVGGARGERIAELQEFDMSYQAPGGGPRFRCNYFTQKGETGFVFRHVNEKIPTFKELCLPEDGMRKLAMMRRGLVLATGVAGSGKSTTLAAMLEYVNQNAYRHIVSVEDPIEFLFTDKQSIFSQREIGLDTETFASALKHVVRQSPDIILIGEMRDKETMEAAISGAETGHLVFSTLHTVNAVQTVERIITYFPPYQHDLIRLQMSMVLQGVISQRLIPRKGGIGRVPAVELLLATPTIKEILYEGRTKDIYNALREGAYYGTQTFNQSLKRLFEEELITLEDALDAADNPDELKLEIRGITKGLRTTDLGF